jgi:nucleoside-diphosphate-sugar epimerase
MRILILGGTIFLGRHVVDEALRRWHELTLSTRGKHGTGPMGVEHVAGDRADVTSLRGRRNRYIGLPGRPRQGLACSRHRSLRLFLLL